MISVRGFGFRGSDTFPPFKKIALKPPWLAPPSSTEIRGEGRAGPFIMLAQRIYFRFKINLNPFRAPVAWGRL